MKNKILSGVWVLAVAVVVCCSGCSRQLTGTVFIVTEGAQTFRLPLTTVEVVKAEEFRKYCKDTATEADLANLKSGFFQEWNKVWEDIRREESKMKQGALPAGWLAAYTKRDLLSANYDEALWNHYFGSMPNAIVPPVSVGQTDADGKFRIQIPGAGEYFVKARTQRSIGEKVEYYRWIVPITISRTGVTSLDLSNQNLGTSSSLGGLLNVELLKRMEAAGEK